MFGGGCGGPSKDMMSAEPTAVSNSLGHGEESYGSAGPHSKSHHKAVFQLAQRRKMNALAMILSLLIPWIIQCAVAWARGFQIRYTAPVVSWGVVVCCVVVVIILGVYAFLAHREKTHLPYHEPTWIIFVFLTSLFGWIGGMALGEYTYSNYTAEVYMAADLTIYTNVDPSRMRGSQMLDAAAIYFTPGTRLDLTKTMGFKDRHMYCVAPVVFKDQPMYTYDYWVVGTDCCSPPPGPGQVRTYHCGAWQNPVGSSGKRLLKSADRAYYRLAVQQAEATYKINAMSPLFFTWSDDAAGDGRSHPSSGGSSAGSSGPSSPLGTSGSASAESSIEQGRDQSIGGGYRDGVNTFLLGAFGMFCIQLLLVLVASVLFSSIGKV